MRKATKKGVLVLGKNDYEKGQTRCSQRSRPRLDVNKALISTCFYTPFSQYRVKTQHWNRSVRLALQALALARYQRSLLADYCLEDEERTVSVSDCTIKMEPE